MVTIGVGEKEYQASLYMLYCWAWFWYVDYCTVPSLHLLHHDINCQVSEENLKKEDLDLKTTSKGRLYKKRDKLKWRKTSEGRQLQKEDEIKA